MIVSYNWLKEYLGEDIPSAENIAELLTFHAFEIESVETMGDDVAIDVKILPDRSSDCLSHRGIAREIATLLDVALVHDPLATQPTLQETNQIIVEIEDAQACPRFTAALITGIEVKESPQWLKDRLATLGQRSINNIVDATNYVMYAIGQPLHAYDADKFPQVDGTWQFGVRHAKEGEVVSLLAEGGKNEDREVTLKGGELLIIDDSSNTPIGLAGVKGGTFAGVDASTKNIIVEAAHFEPMLTRTTARGLGIVIDASKRFENEPSRALPPYAQAEIVKLIIDIAGGTFEGILDVYLDPKTPPTVKVDPGRVNRLLGLELTTETIELLLRRGGITVEKEEDVLVCTGPIARTDLNIEEDFIEEVGRVYGYEHVVSKIPEAVPLAEYNKRHYYSEVVRAVLFEQGFSEVVTSSFRKKDDIQLQNALASDKSYLRSNLTKNISEALDRNVGFTDLLGLRDTRIFEIGTVFTKAKSDIAEHTSLTIGVRLKQSGYTGKEDRPCDEALSAISTALGVAFPAVAEGGQKKMTDPQGREFIYNQGVVEINLSEVLERLPDPETYAPVERSADITYRPFSLFPHMTRDIALWVTEGTTVEVVENVLNEYASDLRVRTTLFDEFTKDGRTSFAFRLVFQAIDRTPTDEEVNSVMERITAAVQKQGWEVR